MLMWFDWPSDISTMKITHLGWPAGLGGREKIGGQSQIAPIHSGIVGGELH